MVRAEMLEAQYKEKLDEWNKRTKSRLPKWFGERPGKKAGAPDTPEGEEDEAEGAVAEEVYEEKAMMRRKSNSNNIDHSNVSTMKNKNHVRLCSLSLLE